MSHSDSCIKQFTTLILAFLITSFAFAQTGTIPAEYRAIKEVYGDLDKDGIAEKVVVYNVKAEEDSNGNGIDRELIIFKKAKAGWTIWHRSLSAIGNSTSGGMMGDPFEDISIKNGVLAIHQSGGSSWKWFTTNKYRYQQGRFELIGYTSSSGKPCEHWTWLDYNLSTGRIAYKTEFEKCDDSQEEQQVVFKTEKEIFIHKLLQPVTLVQWNAAEIRIVTPKNNEEFYL